MEHAVVGPAQQPSTTRERTNQGKVPVVAHHNGAAAAPGSKKGLKALRFDPRAAVDRWEAWLKLRGSSA